MFFEGIYTPIITPFAEGFEIDHDGFAQTIEFLLDAGVQGIVVGGTTGEYYAQTSDERVGLLRAAKQMIGGRAPLIAGVGALRTEDAVALAEQAKAIGADALLLGSPYYAVPTEEELAAHALEVDAAAGLPIMLYNYPSRTGVMMGRQFLDIVGAHKNFAVMKESSGSIEQLHVLALDYPHIQLSCGMDDQALEFFAWGARSWVCAASNFAPEEHLALYRACVVHGDYKRGRAIMTAMMPLMRTLEQGGKFVQSVKHGCELRGLPTGPVRKPLRAMSEAGKADLAQVIATMRQQVRDIEEARPSV